MSETIVLKKGLNIPLKGEAEQRISKTISADVVAIRPSDFKGLLPRLLVKEGDKVLAGSPVLADKKNPAIIVASPASGTVKEVVRGEKRKLLAVLIQTDDEQQYVDFGVHNPDLMSADQIRETLLASGLWPYLVQRPYGIIADPDITPKAIFVSAFNSAPLAANAEFALGGEVAWIQRGVAALGKLTGGGIHLGLSADNCASTPFHKIEGVVTHVFKGKHPAGNVGVQISHILPIRKDTTVWTVSLLGLAVIGRLLATGRYNPRRKVAVTGPLAIEPSYVDALPGTPMRCLAPFVGGAEGEARVISGDVLTGENVGMDGYLGFFDSQVTLVREGVERELFGWIRPVRYKQFSTDHCYFSWLTPWRKYDIDTNLHGGPRAFLMNDAYYGKVLPMDIYPLYLTKACLAGDIDKMEKFGIYEVLPEDLALCEYVDPSKNDIQDIIAKGIDLMLKEMA